MKEYNRKCPECGEEIFYTRKFDRNRAEKRNTNCKSCSAKGHVPWNKGVLRTEEEKKNISKSLKGENHPMYGKKRPEHSERMNGENNPMYGKSQSQKTRNLISEKARGKKNPQHSEWMKGENNPSKRPEVRKKMRLSAIKKGLKFPNYNPKGCKIIDEYNKKYGFNFQHAENGGEVCIDGYWPDGLDEKRKTIIEIDEPKHFNSDGTYIKKDIQRQEYLENLGYKFIRIKF